MDDFFHCLLIDETPQLSENSPKASFLRHHLSRDINKGHLYASGTGVLYYPLMLTTTVGQILFKLWDSDNVRGKCYNGADCIIIFRNLDSFVSGRKRPNWEKKIYYLTERIKLDLVICPKKIYINGKLDLRWTDVMLKETKILYYNHLDDLESPQNIEDIFLWFVRHLKKDFKLQFITYPLFLPKFFAKSQHLPKCLYCKQKDIYQGFDNNLSSQTAATYSMSKLSLSSDTSEEERPYEQKVGDYCECGIKVHKKEYHLKE